MTETTRETLLRTYDQAGKDLDRCLGNLRRLERVYEPAHPMQHSMIVTVTQSVLEIQRLLRRIRKELA